MIFGDRLINGLVLVCCLFSFNWPVQAASGSSGGQWTVEQLVMELKEQRASFLSFEESTYSSLLTEPLKVRGELRFTPPATMEKLILEPFRERYVIEGDLVSFESERRHIKRTISLEEYPALRSFVEAFRASFTGDARRLQEVYEVTLGGDRGEWTLLLRPREAAGRSVVDYILFTGSHGTVASIAIRSPDGDRSVMRLHRGGAR